MKRSKPFKLIVDTNEFVFAFGLEPDPAAAALIKRLRTSPHAYSLHISRTIVEEVRNNLSPARFKEFINFIHSLTEIDEDFLVPFELGAKYEALGLKPADASIAGYAEWVEANVVVSENRHFLARSNTPFKVVTAAECLKLL